MCGRYTLRSNLNRILQQFAADAPAEFELIARYNIAPTQQVPVIRAEGGGRHLSLVRWGLVPFWAKDDKIGSRMINARSESAAEKPAFRAAFTRRRCLVPADGFYEWQKRGSQKQPYYIGLRDGDAFAFAGLWERWKGPPNQPLGRPLETCTILTTDANGVHESLHDRMPVILPPDMYDLWLDAEFTNREALTEMLRPYPADEMVAYPVSTVVNNARNEDPECVAPLTTSADGRLLDDADRA